SCLDELAHQRHTGVEGAIQIVSVYVKDTVTVSDTFFPSKKGEFGPPDSEGFRNFSLFSEQGVELLRVGLNITRFEEEFNRTSSSLERYSEAEIRGLRGVAALLAARRKSDPAVELAILLDLLIPTLVPEQTEKLFPTLALMALDAVSEAC